MHERQVVVITGASGESCERLQNILNREADLEIHSCLLKDGHLDVAAIMSLVPRLVVLDIDKAETVTLREWSASTELRSLSLIVVGPSYDSKLMRTAMQAGARDYFATPVTEDELLTSVRQVMRESHGQGQAEPGGCLTAVIDAKGGSGASFVASNLAHILAAHRNRKTALIDLDLQFGALPLSFDLHPHSTLFDAIGGAEQMDPVALRAYMTEHASGLQVLGTMTDELVMPWEVSLEAVQTILRVALQSYTHVVVDLPRLIDPLSTMVLGAADHVLVVMERSFAHLRDAQRMFNLLRGYVGVPAERISLVINRNEDKSPISDDDIRNAIRPSTIMYVPNDYEKAVESLNTGIPLYQGARNAAITRALCEIADMLEPGGEPPADEAGPAERRHGLAQLLGLRK